MRHTVVQKHTLLIFLYCSFGAFLWVLVIATVTTASSKTREGGHAPLHFLLRLANLHYLAPRPYGYEADSSVLLSPSQFFKCLC